MPVRDWTVGVEIADIVDVREGDADSNDAMTMIVVPTGVHYGTDVMTLATLSFEAVASGGRLNLGLYLSPGKFVVSSDNGKLLLLNFSTPSSAPSVSTLYDDAGGAPITAMAHAVARNEIVFSVGNKVHTMPSAGGAATERADTEAIADAGSRLFDIDYSSQGWLLIIENANETKSTAIASEDWSSILTDNLPDALSASSPLQVNYTEETNTWIVARQDGEVVTTDDLDTWRPEAGSPAVALWTVAGENGNISYSADAVSWTTYQVPAGTNVGHRSISYGLDASNNGVWMTSRWWDSSGEAGMTSDITAGVGGWTTSNTPITSGIDCAFGNGVWIMVGKSKTARSADFGATWQTVTSTGGENMNTNALNGSVATDGAGNWVIIVDDGSQYKVYKSTDNGATWSASLSWGWLAAAQHAFKEVSYGNGVWILATSDNKIRTCTDAGLATNSWATAATLSGQPRDVQYGAFGIWMAVGTDKKCWVSADNGANWSEQSTLHHAQAPGVYAGVHAVNVAYYDGSWIAVMDTATLNNVFKSDDNGFTWAAIANTGEKLSGIAYSSVLPNS